MATTASNERSWYLILSKPRQERVAKENLERQGYEIYLPMASLRKRVARRYQDVIEPLFPRYLFIHLDTCSDNWAPIRSTLGVQQLVRFGMEPARVPDLLIQQLKTAETEHQYDGVLFKAFKQGDEVRLVDGAMAGFEGIFKAKTSKERVIVLLNIAGRYAEVSVPENCLERVSVC